MRKATLCLRVPRDCSQGGQRTNHADTERKHKAPKICCEVSLVMTANYL